MQQIIDNAPIYIMFFMIWSCIGSIVISKGICRPIAIKEYNDEADKFFTHLIFIWFNIFFWPFYVVFRFLAS